MQIGEQQLPFTKLLALQRLRFFYFDHHIRFGKDFFGRLNDLCPCIDVIIVWEASPLPCLGFDQNLMTCIPGLFGGHGGHADPVFLIFDFFRATNAHHVPPPAGRSLNDKNA